MDDGDETATVGPTVGHAVVLGFNNDIFHA